MNRAETRKQVLAFLDTICRAGRRASDVDDETDLISAGIIDSLSVVQIILYLEQEHSIKLREVGIEPESIATVSGILKLIDDAEK